VGYVATGCFPITGTKPDVIGTMADGVADRPGRGVDDILE
jgi:hypothetical protein